ncbi:hypothetical protein ACQ4PT_019976 [Festuca glaucescens]
MLTGKALTCSLLLMLLVLSSEEVGVAGRSCDCEYSRTWSGKLCIKHGTCNRPCRAEGYDNGGCEGIALCLCCKKCDG